jgi:hypothetical protein
VRPSTDRRLVARRTAHPASTGRPRHHSSCLQGIDPEEIIATVHTRRVPMMSAGAGLRL